MSMLVHCSGPFPRCAGQGVLIRISLLYGPLHWSAKGCPAVLHSINKYTMLFNCYFKLLSLYKLSLLTIIISTPVVLLITISTYCFIWPMFSVLPLCVIALEFYKLKIKTQNEHLSFWGANSQQGSITTTRLLHQSACLKMFAKLSSYSFFTGLVWMKYVSLLIK